MKFKWTNWPLNVSFVYGFKISRNILYLIYFCTVENQLHVFYLLMNHSEIYFWNLGFVMPQKSVYFPL